MEHLYFIFFLAAIFGCLLAMLLLLVFGKKKRLPNILLSLALSAVLWYAVISLLILSGEIRNFPDLYNKGNPFYYLFAPCCYLYVLMNISPQRGFRKTDWLHFLFPFLALIDIIPYALLKPEEKQHIVDLVASDDSWNYRLVYAFVPQKIHYLIRCFQMIIYLVLQWRLVILYANSKDANRRHKQWLFFFNSVITVLVLTLSGMITLAVALSFHKVVSKGVFPFVLGIGMLVLTSGLFFWPEVLYGSGPARKNKDEASPEDANSNPEIVASISEPPAPPVVVPEKKVRPLVLSEESIQRTTRLLEEKMEEKEFFREQGITINKLASEINISPRNLSFLLNTHYNTRFTDFINQYRVTYVKRRIRQGDLKNITIEGLADEAGFSSRSTFYQVFKKVTGLTPLEYISNLNGKTEE